MESVFAALIGGLCLALISWFLQRGRKNAAAPPQDLGATLHQLGGKIATFSKQTIHPRDYLGSPDFRQAAKLFESSRISLDLVRQYITAGNGYLASAALDGLSRRADRQQLYDPVVLHFHHLSFDAMHFALRYFLRLESRPSVGGPFVLAQDWWADNTAIVDSFGEYLRESEKLGDRATFGTWLDWRMASPPGPIQRLLDRVDHPYTDLLRAELRDWARKRLDETFLNGFGRFWRRADEEELLVEPPVWTAGLDTAEKAVLAPRPRSVLVSGPARAGKTAFLKLLGERLAENGWRVFEASAADLMADQFYIGMLEGRVRQTVAELDAGKNVAWFVRDIVQMAESGTHRGQSASILDQILPAMTAGRLVVLAEATPEAASRLFQKHPSLRAQMEVQKLEPFTQDDLAFLAGHVAKRLAARANVAIPADSVSAALQLANQYLGGGTLPGLVVDLLKRAVERAKAARQSEVARPALLDALSQITGLPAAILDEDERIDLAELKAFFATRIIGQDGAVSTIVDRIAMLKAGLTDPGRPVGVFLFVGPTGTGKTELAKVLAEYLFGSPERMTRLDMSEFQSAYSIAKILGEAGVAEADSLAERIRKQPFSVILLDEFEKAHPNVWDLFLQIFDDARLTDANGRTVDFRHTIIILTSNLGATDHRSGGLGFVPGADSYGEEQLMRAVARAFRPEFVNRLDKVVVFKPLTRELMREILHKELRQVLERRGLRNREWVVEWEPSAVDFLLEKGFSPEMGARPLKRAIDHYLLAPLASTLVEHRFPEGDQFLFVRSNGRAIEVEFVDPDAEEPQPTPLEDENPATGLGLAAMILAPQGLATEGEALNARCAELEETLRSEAWRVMKLEAQTAAADPAIWKARDRHAVFAKIELIDRITQAMATTERLKRRLESGRKPGGKPSREIVARLALQLHLAGEGIADALSDAPVDAVLLVEPLPDGNREQCERWCQTLTGMYRRWAERRRMQFEELSAPDGPALLHVSGFGAFRTLENEAGLHILEDDEAGGRISARVRIAAGPAEEPRPDQAYRKYLELFARPDESVAVIRRYREKPAPLVRDAKAGWRSGRLDMVLGGNFDLVGAPR